MARQNTHVSRVVQDNGYSYRKDLTEVFDCRSGKIKVDIPQSLFKGADLIAEPAAVMDRLLLEPKNDGESMRPNDGTLGKVYSLVDMFNQDEFLEDNLARPSSGGHVATSSSDSTIKGRNYSPLPHDSSGVSSSGKVEPSRNGDLLGTFPQHNELLARALSGQIQSSFPLIQVLYNNYLHLNGINQFGVPSSIAQTATSLPANFRSQSGVGSVTSSNGSPFDTSDSGSDDEARKWGHEETRSNIEQNLRSGSFPSALHNSGFSNRRLSPERRAFSSAIISEEIPKVRQGTVKGLFTAFSAQPLEI